MSTRRRLDSEMVRRGLAQSRSKAREAVETGRVTVDGAPTDKPSRLVDPGQAVVFSGPPARYVSRGGKKLEAALDEFDLDPRGLAVVDVGSSTGGFTDCLLQHGASTVTAIDVGRGQLHQRLRDDDRVTVHERTNVRNVDVEVLGGPFDLLVGDLSFISLRTVMADLVRLVRDGSDMVLLVKPQFEAGKAEVDRGRGVVRDPEVWTTVLEAVYGSVRLNRAAIMGGMPSPIKGADGNVEFFVNARTGVDSTRVPPLDVATLVAAVGLGPAEVSQGPH